MATPEATPEAAPEAVPRVFHTKAAQIKALKMISADMVNDAKKMDSMSTHELEIQLAQTMAAVCALAMVLTDYLESQP